MVFAMAGGGTGGHVMPSLAVAAELARRGHAVFFIGTRAGMEARLVPARCYEIEWIEIGGVNRVGWRKAAASLLMLPRSVARSRRILQRRHAAAVFSMGGYVAAPVVLAAVLKGIPVVAMEPNAMPGLVSRRTARWVERALTSWDQTARWFPEGKAERTGLPVRREFFEIPRREAGEEFHVLVTGGSRGSRTLNRAARECWPLLRESGWRVHMTVQCGRDEAPAMQSAFADAGVDGAVVPFIDDMAAAYASADLVVSRSGAGAVSELAAAGKPALLVPFPYAADDHQRHNAEAMAAAGAAVVVADHEMDGRRLFDEIARLRAAPQELAQMGERARSLALAGAAGRAADVLESVSLRIDTREKSPKQ